MGGTLITSNEVDSTLRNAHFAWPQHVASASNKIFTCTTFSIIKGPSRALVGTVQILTNFHLQETNFLHMTNFSMINLSVWVIPEEISGILMHLLSLSFFFSPVKMKGYEFFTPFTPANLSSTRKIFSFKLYILSKASRRLQSDLNTKTLCYE